MPDSRAESAADRIMSIAQGYMASAVLKTALELDLFSHIAHGDNTADKLAAAKQLPVRSTRILCDALVALDLLSKSSGIYSLSEASATMLVKGLPTYMGGIINLGLGPSSWGWKAAGDLGNVVKAGHSLLERPAETPEHPFWEDFQRYSQQMAASAAPVVVDIAAQALGAQAPGKILDIACGSGIYGFSALTRFPHATLVSVDWPNVLKLTEPIARQYGVSKRTELRPGDIFKDDLGSGYDLALAVNIYHHFSIEKNLELSRRLYHSLAPGGALLIVDFIPDEGRAHNRWAQMFALTMLLWTQDGDSYTFSEYQRMLEPAGFRDLALKEGDGQRPVQAVVARK